ncbi:hypothetical protein CaCOL14_013179 [Colletotrichum acutatum]
MAGASSRRARGSSGATTEDINEDANKDAEDDTNEDTNEDANDDIPVAYAIQISPSPSCSHGQLTATFRLSASNRLGAFTVIYVSISATSTSKLSDADADTSRHHNSIAMVTCDPIAIASFVTSSG